MTFRERWTYAEADPSILLFDRAVKAWGLELPEGARVLELGCCETNFSHWLRRADPNVRLTGVDVNSMSPNEDYKGLFVQSAAERCDFDPSSFEAVIILGALEHFGLGFYGDPVDEDADIKTLLKVADWLVPGGWVYYDVPWTPRTHYVTENRHFRVYDDFTLPMVDGLTPTRRAYAHGETLQPHGPRPEQPVVPFWYVSRLLEKQP
jgi:SAM-dependent methyltransferase